MALAEMGKLNLIAMSYDRDAVLNALQRTGATEIKLQKETEATTPMTVNSEELSARLASVEAALGCLCDETENYNKENKIKPTVEDLEISFTEFTEAENLRGAVEEVVAKITALQEQSRQIRSEITKNDRTIKSAEIYSVVKLPLCGFADTQHAKIRLGTIPVASVDNLMKSAERAGLLYIETLSRNTEEALLCAAYHKSAVQEVEPLLQEANFTACPFAGDDRSGEELYNCLIGKRAELANRLESVRADLLALSGNIRTLKIYCDYLAFELEKAELSEKMRETRTTFLLEAYVPKEAQDKVKEALEGVSGAVYYEFSEPAEDEIPPTLYKNNAVVKNFETITNMYSPVNSREFDPNTIMAVFYSIFLGFIMGDIGYGLLMFLGGGAIYMKNRAKDSGLKRLSGVFAIGGICAIVWGLLFNSFFGITLSFMPTVMPNAKDDMWKFMGISIPAVLVISLEIGIVQLLAGYICKAVQYWRRKKVWDGIWDGVTWAVFSLGVGLAIIGLVDEAKMPILAYIGGEIAGVSLLIAILTAGRHEKLLGKFTKGFGAAYGVINYASDILSYARLYGLMLSGAVIAQIVSQYSVQFVTGGNPALIILGVLLMIIGHAFNLAIGLLGAYIHDARLQYVEFYGRFYEGEGEIFTPLGSQHKYISLNK
ncbi:MAG: V-type ATP synthase subunit I [Clostridia bacterium]|nr:V-type ATP synthase subunit I [Clostridia bacterium]